MRIAPGTVLMKEDTPLPVSIRITRQAGWLGWVAIKSLDPRGLDRQLREVGWTIHLQERSVEKGSFGFNAEARFDRAMCSAIRHAQTDHCNCLEFDQMTEKSICGIPYTSVSIHGRHIEEQRR